MANVRYGQLESWDDGDVSTPNDFMNLAEGSNQVRIFTKPYQFIVHWVKDASGVNRKIKCAIDSCPLCKKGVKSQCRWYVGAIDRSSGKGKILEISSQIYKGIKDYVNDPDWGDVTQYDINIKRGPANSQPLYTVIAKKPRPFTEDEKALISLFTERVQISKFTQPPTVDEVSEKIGASQDEPARMAVGAQKVAATGGGKPAAIDDEEFSFGDEETGSEEP
jgi:hypothetical protein